VIGPVGTVMATVAMWHESRAYLRCPGALVFLAQARAAWAEGAHS